MIHKSASYISSNRYQPLCCTLYISFYLYYVLSASTYSCVLVFHLNSFLPFSCNCPWYLGRRELLPFLHRRRILANGNRNDYGDARGNGTLLKLQLSRTASKVRWLLRGEARMAKGHSLPHVSARVDIGLFSCKPLVSMGHQSNEQHTFVLSCLCPSNIKTTKEALSCRYSNCRPNGRRAGNGCLRA
jgi:hypothetical protein